MQKECDCMSSETHQPMEISSGVELAGNLCHLDLLHWTGRGGWPAHNDKKVFIYQDREVPGTA